jgi:hypothetical protein
MLIFRTRLIQKAKERSFARLIRLNKIYKRNLEKFYQEARKEALEEFEYFKFHPLFIAGIAIYWGEGDKSTKHCLKIANIDPLMIKLFVKFLKEICGAPEDRIRAYVLTYPDLNQNKCKNFWVEQSGLSNNNFTRSIVIKGRHKTRRIPYGLCNINFSSTYEKMYIWLTLLPEEFIKKEYYRKDYYLRG